MGINQDTRDHFPDILKALCSESWHGVKMLELGNQRVRYGNDRTLTGKKFFSDLGVHHTSIDLNGKDGALRLDLSKPIADIGEPFDIVTNFGTTEHVKRSQHQAFKNIHNFVRKGGVMVSVVPAVGFFEGHGHYEYEKEFFIGLSWRNEYNLILLKDFYRADRLNEVEGKLVMAIIRKENDGEFISEEEFYKIDGLVSI